MTARVPLDRVRCQGRWSPIGASPGKVPQATVGVATSGFGQGNTKLACLALKAYVFEVQVRVFFRLILKNMVMISERPAEVRTAPCPATGRAISSLARR
jgi:hypothetical protein